MFKEFTLQTQDGEKVFGFLATGTTAIRYRQVFGEDLLVMLNRMEREVQKDSADVDMGLGDRLAYIMNAQAEKKDMSTLSRDDFMAWADQFDGAELFLHMQDFISLYIGNRKTMSTPKKAGARRSGK